MTLGGAPASLLVAVFAVAALAILLLHLIRARRREVTVAFGPLWDRVLAAEERPWQRVRLRWLVSLLVSLLVLSLVLLAAGDPRSGRRAARSIVIVIDASASMQTRDEAGEAGEPLARIDRARREAARILDGVTAPDRALVLRLDARPRPLGPFTTDARAIAAQLGSLSAGDETADLDGALRVAADLLAGQPGPTLILIGDGAWPDAATARAPLLSGVDLRFVPVGHTGEDVGITAFAARRHPTHPGDFEVLVAVTSRLARPVEMELSIRQSDVPVHTERLSLAPGRSWQRLLPDLAGAGQRLEARLGSLDPGGRPLDAYAADDRAFAVLPPRPRARVLLVSDGNLYLEGALLLDQAAVVDRIAPAAWSDAQAALHDLVVLDRFTPPTPPRVPALYLDPRGAASPFPIRGQVRSPIVTAVAHHPLTRFLSLADLNVTSASRFALSPGDVALASSLSDPIWIARERPRRVVALGFDPRRSDLPLRVAFPVMLIDAIDWLSGGDRVREVAAAAIVGRPVRVPVATGQAEVTVHGPGGRRSSLPVVDGAAHLAPEAAGFYSLAERDDEAAQVIAANLDPLESRIAPMTTLGGRALPRPDDPVRGGRRDPWRTLVLAALFLLVIEWLTFHRRVTE